MLLCVLMGPYISLCPLTCDSAQGWRLEAGDCEKVVSTYTIITEDLEVGPRPRPRSESTGSNLSKVTKGKQQ